MTARKTPLPLPTLIAITEAGDAMSYSIPDLEQAAKSLAKLHGGKLLQYGLTVPAAGGVLVTARIQKGEGITTVSERL